MATEKKVKEEIVHKDRLGRDLKLGDCVGVAHHNGLMVGVIKKINPKMIKVVEVGTTTSWRGSSGHNKYPSEMVLLDGPEVTMFLLRANTAKS